MTHPPAAVVAKLLVDLGLCSSYGGGRGSAGWCAFVGVEPDDPDQAVTAYDTAGPNFGRLQDTGEFSGYDGIQLRVRGATYPTARKKAEDLITTLSAVYDRTVSLETCSYLVHDVGDLNDVVPLGKDSPTARRFLFTVNCHVVVRQTAGA
ncbi:MAG: minor capsid protein [Fimbriiglobus sp.]